MKVQVIGGVWTRGLAPVRIHHDIILIVCDKIVIVATEYGNMSIKVVVVRFIFTTFTKFLSLIIADTLIASVIL